MPSSRATVVIFPGLNAETEMLRTLSLAGFETTTAWHTDTELPARTDLVAVPGGFSYGDYLRCGAIAKVSPIVGAIRAHAERGGFVLGVCNGFQILTECGLIPGALTQNAHMRFECKDVFVRVHAEGPFTPKLDTVWRMPIAHAEGRYQATPETLARLEGEGRIALVYCDASGAVTDAANPNGSLRSIAGVYGGASKNVLGLMPHPERMSEPALGGTDGARLFEAAFAHLGKRAA
ncbi:MAG: phosphoribosylformylglycinamidine synthase I [Myxococcales bacterium]|jgi:phosphoribosylformylglycinamidine synthase|nr:phosphoribosylformylglycinamidine synthase I [Myxococcales bacterium]